MQWERFEKFIEEVMEKEQIPGVAVALSKNGQPIYERGFGTRNLETNEPSPQKRFSESHQSQNHLPHLLL